jgi:hypothetical protein
MEHQQFQPQEQEGLEGMRDRARAEQERPKRKMVDITDQVQGKIEGERMVLLLNDREIGSFSLVSPPVRIDFQEGYGQRDTLLYQIQEEHKQDDQYVEGCDLGWC